MSNYSRSVMKWENYLQANTLAGDIDTSLKRHSNSINSSISNASQEIIDSNIASQKEITRVLQHGFDDVVGGIGKVGESVESLRADFNFAIGEVLWKLELVQGTLTDILQEVRLAEFEREARSLRERAEDAYKNGWYKESLSDFLKAEKQNYQDFAVLFSIANIYLYHSTEYEDNYKEPSLEKALVYYLKSAKYSTPKSKKHAAKSYLFSGWTCYLLKKDNEALEYTSKAIDLNPDLAEAYFQKSKILMCIDDPDGALVPLRKAIEIDRDYSLKACLDEDFKRYKDKLQGLLNKIRTEMQKKAQEELDYVNTKAKQINNLVIVGYYLKDFNVDETKNASSTINKANKSFRSGTLYGYLDSITLSSVVREALVQAVKAFKRRAIECAENKMEDVDTEMSNVKKRREKGSDRTSVIFWVIGWVIFLPLGFSSCAFILAYDNEIVANSNSGILKYIFLGFIVAPLSGFAILFGGLYLLQYIAKKLYSKSPESEILEKEKSDLRENIQELESLEADRIDLVGKKDSQQKNL